ncbi:MAG TPA: isoprenylcysteine carboxylmethyltransferase family protein [Thermoanaerobaculia bacterium]|nr:isoprenylcysteine carboxylmethyltransferase family protein [Thermoanaerobaculia bacterium]
MIKRVGFFAYGLICYAAFFATFLYAVGFIGGFLVPTTLDGTARGPLAEGIAINAALLGLFAIQHSVMARRWFKERWTRIVPPAIERSTYVLFSSLALILVFWQWRPLGGAVWTVQDPAGRAVLRALFGFGVLLVLFATFLINHFDLFGLRQVWLALRGKPYTKLQFGTPVLYRFVRHPLYVGWFFTFWMTPAMTYAHLLFAAATTCYILLAIQFEERDLVHEHGAAYEEYRRKVPMLVPFARGASPARRNLERIGAAAFIAFLIKGIIWLAIAGALLWR